MPREIKKQRGIFERPKGSGIWWICYAGIDGRLHREKESLTPILADLIGELHLAGRGGRISQGIPPG